MALQQIFAYNTPPPIETAVPCGTVLGGNTTDLDTGYSETTATSWFVGSVLILCMVIPVILSIVIKLDERQHQLRRENNQAAEGRPKKIDPRRLEELKVTLNKSHFPSFVDESESTNCSVALPLGFLSVDQGNDDCVTANLEFDSESTCNAVARDTTSFGAKDTDDDSIIRLEEGHHRIAIPSMTGHETRIEDLCAVCLSLYKIGDTMVFSPLCGHAYHYTCLKQAISRDSKCPLCRQDFIPTCSFVKEESGEDNDSVEARNQEETRVSRTSTEVEREV